MLGTAKPKKASREPIPGSIHAIHVKRVGYFPCIITRVPEVQTQVPTVFVWISGTPLDTPEACAAVKGPASWDRVWLGFCTTRAFTTNRWAKVGTVEAFDPRDWPIPPSKYQMREGDPESAELHPDDGSMRVIANLAEPWPTTKVGYIAQASVAEKGLAHFIAGRDAPVLDMDFEFQRVTYDDLAAWTKARASTDKLLEQHPLQVDRPRQVQEGDLYNVPLPGGGFGVVLAARVEPYKRSCQTVLYLGLPIDSDWPVFVEEEDRFGVEDAIGYWKTTTIGVRAGDWAYAGRVPGFTRQGFPVPYRLKYGAPVDDTVKAVPDWWGGRAVLIADTDDLPESHRAELWYQRVTTMDAGVRRDLALLLGRGNPRVGSLQELACGVTPERVRLWRDMLAWTEQQPACEPG